MHSRHPRISAFTLAELLIALAILGVIATFTIPKILQSQQDGRRKAVMKEPVAAFSNAVVEARRRGITPVATGTVFPQVINYVKRCTGAQIASCWPQDLPASCDANDYKGGYILASGATVIVLSSSGGSGTLESLDIDWNGAEPPNEEGEDQFCLAYYRDHRSGKIEGFTPVSTPAFNQLFE